MCAHKLCGCCVGCQQQLKRMNISSKKNYNKKDNGYLLHSHHRCGRKKTKQEQQQPLQKKSMNHFNQKTAAAQNAHSWNGKQNEWMQV